MVLNGRRRAHRVSSVSHRIIRLPETHQKPHGTLPHRVAYAVRVRDTEIAWVHSMGTCVARGPQRSEGPKPKRCSASRRKGYIYIYIYIHPSRPQLASVASVAAGPGPQAGTYAIRKSFQELLWKCKSIYLKQIKVIAEPVATMAGGGPAAGWQWQASSLGQTKGRTVFRLESFESIPETSRSSVETCTWVIWRGTVQFGGQFERRKLAAQLSLWQASFFFSLACWPCCLPTCKVWRTHSKDQWN